jgi:hypothetical protein
MSLKAYFLLLEVRQGLIFVVSLYDVEDGGESLAPIENFSAAHIAGAENSADLIGNDHFLVFSGYLCRSEGNMEIAHYKSELADLLLLSHVDILYSIDYELSYRSIIFANLLFVIDFHFYCWR